MLLADRDGQRSGTAKIAKTQQGVARNMGN